MSLPGLEPLSHVRLYIVRRIARHVNLVLFGISFPTQTSQTKYIIHLESPDTKRAGYRTPRFAIIAKRGESLPPQR